MGRAILRRPGRVLVGVALLGGAGAFAWNALLRQPIPHPAPLFASSRPAPVPAEPPPRPDFAASSTSPSAPARAETAAQSQKSAETARRSASADPIGALLRNSEAKPETIVRVSDPKAATAAPVNPNRTANAQRALAKLGYGPIEADGRLGAATRQALEKFERDRSLPVTGSLATRTTRQLATASGVAID